MPVGVAVQAADMTLTYINQLALQIFNLETKHLTLKNLRLNSSFYIANTKLFPAARQLVAHGFGQYPLVTSQAFERVAKIGAVLHRIPHEAKLLDVDGSGRMQAKKRIVELVDDRLPQSCH